VYSAHEALVVCSPRKKKKKKKKIRDLSGLSYICMGGYPMDLTIHPIYLDVRVVFRQFFGLVYLKFKKCFLLKRRVFSL
jgi:hypothetical protein